MTHTIIMKRVNDENVSITPCGEVSRRALNLPQLETGVVESDINNFIMGFIHVIFEGTDFNHTIPFTKRVHTQRLVGYLMSHKVYNFDLTRNGRQLNTYDEIYNGDVIHVVGGFDQYLADKWNRIMHSMNGNMKPSKKFNNKLIKGNNDTGTVQEKNRKNGGNGCKKSQKNSNKQKLDFYANKRAVNYVYKENNQSKLEEVNEFHDYGMYDLFAITGFIPEDKRTVVGLKKGGYRIQVVVPLEMSQSEKNDLESFRTRWYQHYADFAEKEINFEREEIMQNIPLPPLPQAKLVPVPPLAKPKAKASIVDHNVALNDVIIDIPDNEDSGNESDNDSELTEIIIDKGLSSKKINLIQSMVPNYAYKYTDEKDQDIPNKIMADRRTSWAKPSRKNPMYRYPAYIVAVVLMAIYFCGYFYISEQTGLNFLIVHPFKSSLIVQFYSFMLKQLQVLGIIIMMYKFMRFPYHEWEVVRQHSREMSFIVDSQHPLVTTNITDPDFRRQMDVSFKLAQGEMLVTYKHIYSWEYHYIYYDDTADRCVSRKVHEHISTEEGMCSLELLMQMTGPKTTALTISAESVIERMGNSCNLGPFINYSRSDCLTDDVLNNTAKCAVDVILSHRYKYNKTDIYQQHFRTEDRIRMGFCHLKKVLTPFF